MTVRIGKVELSGVQSMHTEEARTLIEQRVPEQQGSVFQDLGREPVTVVLEGLMVGDEVLSDLETLRGAQAKAEPLSFAADIAAGTDLTEVVIEDLKVRQAAGYRNRYHFTLRLREHVEPPQAAGAATAPVDAGVQSDAAAWGDDSLAAAGVLQDPASLSDALAANPALMDSLDPDALGAAVADRADLLSGGDLGNMLSSMDGLNPAKGAAFFDALGKNGALGGFLQKCLTEGPGLLEKLKNLDLKKFSAVFRAFTGGLEFLNQLKKVADAAGKLVQDIGALQLPPELDRLLKGKAQ